MQILKITQGEREVLTADRPNGVAIHWTLPNLHLEVHQGNEWALRRVAGLRRLTLKELVAYRPYREIEE